MKRRFQLGLLGLGCALFVYLLIRLGAAEIARLLLQIGWSFGVITAIYFGHQSVRALAYWNCIATEPRPSYWTVLRFKISGDAVQFLTSTGPFLGEPAKVWLLSRWGLSTKSAAAATICEYLVYAVVSAAFSVAGLVYLLTNYPVSKGVSISGKIMAGLMAAFLATASYAIINRLYLIGGIIRRLRSIPRIGRHIPFQDDAVRETEDLIYVVLRDRPARGGLIVAVEFAAQMLLVLELFVLLRTTGETFTAITPFIVEGATKFIGIAFFFIPGQIGAAEGVYAVVFKTVGLTASAGFALALARRLRSLLSAGVALILAALLKEPPSEEHSKNLGA